MAISTKQMNTAIQQQVDTKSYSKTGMRIGVVTSYNAFTNTATVILSEADTDAIDEVLTDVPCPTSIGVQNVAPEAGRMCIVVFKNGAVTQPLIVSFFNHSYRSFDYVRQNRAGYTIPSYLMSM
jgi:phage gp45-like